MRDVAREAELLGSRKRFHQLPARKVRAADVADLAGAHHAIQRGERFLHRRQRVEAVQLVEIDVIRAEPPQARIHGARQVVPRRAEVVRPGTARKAALGRNQQFVAPALDRLSEDLLRQAARIDVGRIEHGQSRFEADVHQAGGLGDVAAAPGLEEFIAAAEGAGAQRECRNFQAGSAELSVFHAVFFQVDGRMFMR